MAFRALGPVRLKNIATPVPIFQIGPEDRHAAVLVDRVRQMHVGASGTPARLFEGRTYHFCSLSCARAFSEHPDRYGAR